MSHPMILAIHPGYAEHLVEDSVAGFPIGNIPNETCLLIEYAILAYRICLHAISPFRERLDHEILILGSPSLHDWFRIRVNHGPNIVHDIFLLSALVMKGHRAGCKRIEDVSYVNLWATCDTDMKIWEVKLDKLLHKQEDALARGWNTRAVGTFVKSIHDKVDRTLIWDREHLFQTSRQGIIAGLFRATFMSLMMSY